MCILRAALCYFQSAIDMPRPLRAGCSGVKVNSPRPGMSFLHALPTLVIPLPLDIGLYAVLCPIKLRGHGGDDCHCERDRKTCEPLITKTFHG
jgi:hypothetical protein